MLDYQTDDALGRCPDASAFRDLVRDQLGYDPFRLQAERRVVVRALAQGGGVVRWVDVHSGTTQGERFLPAENQSCEALVRTLSFTVAVQLDFSHGDQAKVVPCTATAATPNTADATPLASTTPPPPTTATPVNPAVARVVLKPVKLPPEAANPWRGSVGLGPGLLLRGTPRVTGEGRAFAAVQHGNASLEVGLGATLPQRLETAPGEGFRHSLVWGSLAGCGLLRPVAGCALARIVRLAVRGYGVDEQRSAADWVVELGPRVALFAALSRRWFATLRVEALFVLNPARVSLNEQPVWRTPGWSLGVGADVGFIWSDNP